MSAHIVGAVVATVPDHLVGKPFDVLDAEGRIVASTRPRVDPRIASMIG